MESRILFYTITEEQPWINSVGISKNTLFYVQDNWIHMEIGVKDGRKTKKETRI